MKRVGSLLAETLLDDVGKDYMSLQRLYFVDDLREFERFRNLNGTEVRSYYFDNFSEAYNRLLERRHTEHVVCHSVDFSCSNQLVRKPRIFICRGLVNSDAVAKSEEFRDAVIEK